MKIETKYDFGKRLYPIMRGTEQYNEKCEFCEGVGYIIHKGKEIGCQECYGEKIVTKFKKLQWFIAKNHSFVVQRISTEHFNPNNKSVSTNGDKITYMAANSGTMWRENELFSSIEEAEKECLKRNLLKDEKI